MRETPNPLGGKALPGEGAAERMPLGPVVYLRCPTCNQLMHRENFGRRSGVIIDKCAKHGIWLDDQELERIARFIAEGGLARVREDEAEELERRARRAKATAEMSTGGMVTPMSGGGAGGSFIGMLGRLLGG